MENPELKSVESEELIISNQTKTYWIEISNWTMFFSILGFVFVGLMMLFGLFFGSILSLLPDTGNLPNGFGFVGIIYVILAVVYLIPVYFLYQFSSKMKDSLRNNNTLLLTESFKNLKSHFKFVGIMSIIGIVLYAVIFVITIGFAAAFGA
ncbi:MAG: hypothetical protein C0595_01920 [Marinilabiliales bacterium]|nr:MAG: hypothetical protein C0595_01920 [Marinilabiliales bacterium]